MSTTLRWLRASGRRVPLLAGPAALAALPETLAEAGFAGRLFLVADQQALELHGATLQRVLAEVPSLAIAGDEQSKSITQLSRVWDWLIDQGAQRRDTLVAFGGGVICDLVGFAAATYLRGIGLVNAPTTLLAQVDASVGGKTAVNHPRGKNLIGAFYQPLCVVADTSLLATLSPRAFANGMAEVIKMAMILDAQLFEQLEELAATLSPGDAEQLTPIIARSIELKAEVVERDEFEAGDRMLLNYGHTVGHALEAVAGYSGLLHGEAVAIGMRAAAELAQALGMLEAPSAQRQQALIQALGLPQSWPAPAAAVLSRLSVDKKRAGARQRWILPERIGAARIRDDVPPALVEQIVHHVTATPSAR